MTTSKEHNYEHWISTFSGHPIDPLNPEPKRIFRTDIAHALSNQCRFSGHPISFYSVAQHSVLVSKLLQSWDVPLRVRIRGLYHDASEAYLVDMPTPIKRQMPEYTRAETPLQRMIEDTLFPEYAGDDDLRHDDDLLIKKADLILLATEARDLMSDPKDWKVLRSVTPLPSRITPVLPVEARRLFNLRHEELCANLKHREARR